mmetsp:Transcript_23528/g.73249  ORF Transcript_23528/g.73249 Transcript_23528/m.73249 type:complete len:258 (+) Transcript_23528:671-1444(+)
MPPQIWVRPCGICHVGNGLAQGVRLERPVELGCDRVGLEFVRTLQRVHKRTRSLQLLRFGQDTLGAQRWSSNVVIVRQGDDVQAPWPDNGAVVCALLFLRQKGHIDGLVGSYSDGDRHGVACDHGLAECAQGSRAAREHAVICSGEVGLCSVVVWLEAVHALEAQELQSCWPKIPELVFLTGLELCEGVADGEEVSHAKALIDHVAGGLAEQAVAVYHGFVALAHYVARGGLALLGDDGVAGEGYFVTIGKAQRGLE